MEVVGIENISEMAAVPPQKIARIEAEPTMRVVKLNEFAVLPKRASAGAAGYDLSR